MKFEVSSASGALVRSLKVKQKTVTRTNSRVQIVHTFWQIEIKTISELMGFIKGEGEYEVVISAAPKTISGLPEIKIYDDYLE